jgi:hypothetical protein
MTINGETRYRKLLVRYCALERRLARREALDVKWRCPSSAGVAVRTCGPTSPGSGVMLWYGGGNALVWFTGCDRPVVWPCENLEAA